MPLTSWSHLYDRRWRRIWNKSYSHYSVPRAASPTVGFYDSIWATLHLSLSLPPFAIFVSLMRVEVREEKSMEKRKAKREKERRFAIYSPFSSHSDRNRQRELCAPSSVFKDWMGKWLTFVRITLSCPWDLREKNYASDTLSRKIKLRFGDR